MKINTDQLIGSALDWAVGHANGWITYPTDSIERGSVFHTDSSVAPFGRTIDVAEWKPSTNPAQAWPIIERERLNFLDNGDSISAYYSRGRTVCQRWNGPTHLVAAMRCYIASKLGDEVDVPNNTIGDMLLRINQR